MAMPVAMGIEGMTSKLDKATITSGSPRVDCPNTIIQTSDRAAAEANHLICWRSSPLDRRKRTNTEITAPSPTSIMGNPMKSTNTCNTWEAWDGLSSPVTSPGPLSGQYSIVYNTTTRPMERAPSQATGRQRCEGG